MDDEALYDVRRWSKQTFGGCRLADERHRKRVIEIGAILAQRPADSLSAACGTDEAARLGGYRLIENDRVNPDAIAEGGFAATVERADDVRRMLAASDTTTLSFSHAASLSLGDVGGPKACNVHGWHVHSSLLINADGPMVIGLIDQQWRCRDPAGRGRKHQRKQRAYNEKESFKWQATSVRLSQRLGPVMDRVIELCDAEADVYEFLDYKVKNNQRFIVRVSQNRCLSDADEKLWTHLGQQEALGQITVNVPQRGGRVARQATLTLRAAQVTLRPPSRLVGPQLEPLTLNAVLVEELSCPSDAEPLHWRLYTGEPAQTFEQVKQVTLDYGQRWQVEDFHKAWKSGCKVEEQRQQTPCNLQRMAQIRGFVATRLLQLKQHAALAPETPCEPLLDRVTWKCLYLSTEKDSRSLPDKPPSQRWALHAVARLGGWNDSKHTGRPGWAALIRGWDALQSRITGYRLALAGPL